MPLFLHRCKKEGFLIKQFIMPPTLKKLMGHIAFGACVRACLGACVRASHFLYLL